jgi:regulator of RNase E activity RraA
VPVSIGGWIVNPGDVVVGDEDGIVTFPPDIAPALIEAVRVQEAREAEILQMIRDGKYDGRYGRAA